MSRPADTCPECGAEPVRSLLVADDAHDCIATQMHCAAGHMWLGDRRPREPSTDERIANIESAISALLAWAQALDPGMAVAMRDAIARFETRRPT